MVRRRLSIALTLIVVLVTVVTLLLGSFAAVVFRNEEGTQRDALRRQLAADAEQIAAALALPMWNIDASHVKDIVQSAHFSDK